MADRHLAVFVQIDGDDLRAGDLWSHRRRGTESATFAYSSSYLGRPEAYALDPGLPFVTGQQQTRAGQKMFGAFSDCAPDRWGRTLVDRAERESAAGAGRAERSFGEVDYLLGARDDMRQGALRFREPTDGPFLAPPAYGVPTLVEVPDLLAAAERAERGEPVKADLALLLNGGSSLGGARPKAHVIDERGRPAIAKFPSPAGDSWDVMRWEAVALELAAAAQIKVPTSQLLTISGRAVLVIERFDRTERENRLGYMSAMSMLETSDGDRGSYLEIADAIERESPDPVGDLAELWRRIAFSILISNTDDHLRNHGFLRQTSGGWSLSPAFDLNPNPAVGPKELSTAIDFENREARLDVLLEVAPEFRLDPDSARGILGEVADATSRWQQVAARHGLSAEAQSQMAPAFEAQLAAALELAT
ncbi:MAG TPA: HipA domain-containing protein [Solirubrobacterales bacterium]|jgi:serine/threonine-protein kinase HipA|nr:HipA domain-containing protein [Solirubrobacterales bacterium]